MPAALALLCLLVAPASAGTKKLEVPNSPVAPALPAAAVKAALLEGTNLQVHAYGQTVTIPDVHAYGPTMTQTGISAQHASQPAAQKTGALAPVAEQLSKPDLSPAQAKSAAADDWAPRIGEEHRPLDIIQVAAEAAPFVKTGGLADVMDGLSRELVKKGHRVTLVLPNYKNFKRAGLALTKIAQVSVPVAGRVETADVLHAKHAGVDLWLLDGALFNTRDGPYADSGKLHPDNDERFVVLARAALEAAKALGRKPDVVHAHDWHAALVAPMLKLLYHDEPAFIGTRSVVTIHNIAYQGAFASEAASKAGFSTHDFAYDKLSHHGQMNFLKAGLQYADALTTVSPHYSRETQTPAFGNGLEDLLAHRADRYHGIINGLDVEHWNPSSDDMLYPYGVDDAARGKAAAKKFIQESFGLDVDPSKPLFVVLSRVDPQKGVDIVAETAGVIDALDGQLFVLGGAQQEPSIDWLAERMPGRFFRHAFNVALPKALLAAADFLLMPSRFEPCGLSQLQALLMGTIPIVTPTGGLVDTVKDLSRPGGDGIVIARPDAISLAEGVARARRLYDDPQKLAQARRRGMTKDVGWSKPTDGYLELFRRLVFGEPR